MRIILTKLFNENMGRNLAKYKHQTQLLTKKTQKLAGLHTSGMSLIRGNKAVSQCFCILSTYNSM